MLLELSLRPGGLTSAEVYFDYWLKNKDAVLLSVLLLIDFCLGGYLVRFTIMTFFDSLIKIIVIIVI